MAEKRGGRKKIMLPRFSYNSPVILTFSIIALCAYIASCVTDGASNTLIFSVYRSSPKSFLTYIRLFTHVFGHTSFSHFSGNICMILVVGPMVEEKYGSRNLI